MSEPTGNIHEKLTSSTENFICIARHVRFKCAENRVISSSGLTPVRVRESKSKSAARVRQHQHPEAIGKASPVTFNELYSILRAGP